MRQVQATSDPFRDPFGDRYAQRPGPTFTQQPATPGAPDPGALPPAPAPPANPNLAPPAFDLPNPANPAAPPPFAPEPANPAAPAPAPAPAEPAIPANPVRPSDDPLQFQPPNRIRQVPQENAPAPQPYNAEPMLRSGGGMRSIYNELDCGKVDQNCQAFVKRLMADKLANISLDITPRYMPDLDPAEDEAKRDDQLKQSAVRDWKDAAGQVLASGRLLRLENGDAVIGDAGAEPARVPIQEMGDDEICFIAGWYRLPAECILRDTRKDVALLRDNRQWLASTYTWHASALCHKPLYFEEAQLERYGHTAGRIRQPLLSGAHFFGSMILLPYQMAISPPWECEYSLGYYRPGSCAPWHIPPFPFSPRAALTQAGVVVGGIMIVP